MGSRCFVMTQRENTLPFMKLFDPFAILEPERVTVNTNTGTKTENFGSLLTVKKDADVVDMLENLFVTPRQVSRSNTDFDKEFAKFLDKYEDEKIDKLIDIDGFEQPKVPLEEDIKVFEPKLHLLNELDEDSIDELISNKSIESNRLKRMPANVSLGDSIAQLHIPREKHEPSLNNSASKIVITNSKIELKTPIKDNLKNIQYNIETPKVINNEPFRQIAKQSSKLTTQHSYELFIETVLMDPKLYQKRRTVRRENEILNFTKGANLNEKRIILPQIMDRLMEKKVEREIKNKLPKKLMLDTGKSVTPSNVSVSPKEITPRDFLLKNPEYFNKPQIGNLNVSQPETKISPNSSKSVSKNKSNDLCASCSEKSKNVQNFSIKDLEREILLAMISRKIDATKLKQESSNAEAELSPVVLMEDCKKQRLIEMKKLRLFQNFVRNGKM